MIDIDINEINKNTLKVSAGTLENFGKLKKYLKTMQIKITIFS